MTLHGKNGQVELGDQVVATKAQWTLNPTRKYVDAPELGEGMLRGLPDVSGTFEGRLDAVDYDLFAGITSYAPQTMYLYTTPRPAWWGRLKHRLLKTEWPSYVYAEGPALVDYQIYGQKSQGTFRFSGSIMLHLESGSRLERAWDRLCTTIKTHLPRDPHEGDYD